MTGYALASARRWIELVVPGSRGSGSRAPADQTGHDIIGCRLPPGTSQ